MTFPRRPHRPVRVIKPARPATKKGGCLFAALPAIAVLAALALAITTKT